MESEKTCLIAQHPNSLVHEMMFIGSPHQLPMSLTRTNQNTPTDEV